MIMKMTLIIIIIVYTFPVVHRLLRLIRHSCQYIASSDVKLPYFITSKFRVVAMFVAVLMNHRKVLYCLPLHRTQTSASQRL
jgi:hypothetical protein